MPRDVESAALVDRGRELFEGTTLTGRGGKACNACHDSFVNDWKLKDAYALAAYFSPEPKLQLYRCDIAQNKYAEPAFLFPEITHTRASDSLADRRAAAVVTVGIVASAADWPVQYMMLAFALAMRAARPA